MPNWCNNNLSVTGPKAGISAFRKWLGKDGFKLNKIAPLPKELDGSYSPHPNPESKEAKALVKKYGANNWYDWQVANWGTKWDVDAEVNEENDTGVYISFDSAWSPPCAAIAALSEKFPKLSFNLKYIEMGMSFAGEFIAKNGEINDDSYDEKSSPEKYKKMMEFFGFESWQDADDL